ncbi:MAG: ABC transporter substrate-binding protein [Dehalococcoidia bacterium]
MREYRWLAMPVVLAGVLLAAAACGSGSKSTTPTQAPSGGATTPAASASASAAAATQCNKAANPSEGVTATEISIGNTDAYSGPASAYAVIAKSIGTYFKWVNDQGGVNGRKIKFTSLDDGYSPPKTVEQTRALVEQDHIFADFNPLGTPPNTAIRQYLNDKGVPQIFVATGAATWALDHPKYPCTIGWQPNYQSEAIIYAKYLLANKPNAKIAVLYQNDDYGKDYLKGLQTGLGAQASQMIVKEESYETSEPDVSPHVTTLKNTGADVFIVIATPKFAAQAMKAADQLAWKPLIIDNSVSVDLNTMKAAGAGADGVISAAYLKDPSDPAWASDATVKQYKDILAKYASGADPNNVFNFYGFAVADTFVQALKQAGQNLTREGLMKAADNLSYTSPYMLPGITIHTSDAQKDWAPIEQMQLEKFNVAKGTWERFGQILEGAVR